MKGLLGFLKEKKISFDISFTREIGQAIVLAKEASQNYPLVVAVGGDGTVNEVVNGLVLAGKGSILGVIPVGGANDFAHGAGIYNLQAAQEALLGRQKKEIDIGEVNGRYFVNVCGIGFDARVAQEVWRYRQRFPLDLGYLGYFLAILKCTLFPVSLPVILEGKDEVHDGWKQEGRFLMIAAVNVSRYGKIFCVAPRAKLDDGWLDICVVDKIGPLKCTATILKFIAGTQGNLPEVRIFRSQKIIIRTTQEVVVHVDGEILPPNNFFQIILHPRKLSLLIPPSPINLKRRVI